MRFSYLLLLCALAFAGCAQGAYAPDFTTSTETLIKQMRKGSPSERRRAAEILKQRGPSSLNSLVRALEEEIRVGEPSIEELAEKAIHGSPEERKLAEDQLRSRGPEAISALIDALSPKKFSPPRRQTGIRVAKLPRNSVIAKKTPRLGSARRKELREPKNKVIRAVGAGSKVTESTLSAATTKDESLDAPKPKEATKQSEEDLLSTTWSGIDSHGERYTFTFLANGALRYTNSIGTYENGTWEQHGKLLLMSINDGFSEYSGMIDGDTISGRARNKKDEHWTWQAERKETTP